MKFPYNNIISLLDDRLALNLAESTNKDLLLQEIWDESFEEGLKALKLEYGTSQGGQELRYLIAEKLGVDKKNILITNGAVFGIFLSILCSCEPEDEIITLQPNFPPTMDVIEGLGFKKKFIKLSFENCYKLHEEYLFNSISDNTKLIILVSPLNPTGTKLDSDQVIRISDRLSVEHPSCKILVDETYREATYGNNEVIPTFSGLRKNILTVSSLSKCHGTPGLRIGWLYSSDDHFIKELSIAKMNIAISNSVLDEYVAVQVIKKEKEIFRLRRIHSQKGLELTRDWVALNQSFISWIEPSAGALCCIKLSSSKFNEADLEVFYSLAKQEEIQIASGEWFGETNRYFRLGFGYMDAEKLAVALNKLTEVLNRIAARK